MPITSIKLTNHGAARTNREIVMRQLQFLPNSMFPAFSKLFNMKTKNIACSNEILQVKINKRILGFDSNEIVIQRDLNVPSVVKIQNETKSESFGFEKYIETLEVNAVIQKDTTLIEPKLIQALLTSKPDEFWEFLRDKVFLVKEFEQIRDEAFKQNVADYMLSLEVEEQRKVAVVKIQEIEKHIAVLEQAKSAKTELKMLKNLVNFYEQNEREAKYWEISEKIDEKTTEIIEIDREIETMKDTLYERENQKEALTEAIEGYNNSFYDFKLQTFEQPRNSVVSPKFEQIETLKIPDLIETYLKSSKETVIAQRKVQEIHAELETTQSKINFLNLLKARSYEDAESYLKSMKGTVKFQKTTLKSRENEKKIALKEMTELRNEVEQIDSENIKKFNQWQLEVQRETTKFQEYLLNYKTTMTNISNLKHNIFQLQYHEAANAEISRKIKSKCSISKATLDGLVALEKFLLETEAPEGFIKPLYKLINLVEEKKYFEAEFTSILPYILVNDQIHAEFLLEHLPNSFEYTFLVISQFHPMKAAIIRRSKHRDLIFPVKFLSTEMHKTVIKLIESLLQNHAVSPEADLKELIALKETINFTLENAENDKVTNDGVLSGGYDEKKCQIKLLKDYIGVQLSLHMTKTTLEQTKNDLDLAETELEAIKVDLIYLISDHYLPLQLTDASQKWLELVDTNVHHAKQGILLNSAQILLDASQTVVNFAQRAMTDSENISEAESAEDLYVVKMQFKEQLVAAEKVYNERKSQENDIHKKIHETLVNLKEIERSFEVNSQLSFVELCENFNKLAVDGVQKINETIEECVTELLEHCIDLETQLENLNGTDITDNEIIEAREIKRFELSEMRRTLIRTLKKEEKKLQHIFCTKPTQNAVEQFPNIDRATQRHSEILQFLHENQIPHLGNLSTFNGKTALLEYQRLLTQNGPVSSAFVDNIGLIYKKITIRALRKVLAIFHEAMKFIFPLSNIHEKFIRLHLRDVPNRIEIHPEDVLGLEFNTNFCPQSVAVVVFLIAISISYQRPFVVLYDFLKFIPFRVDKFYEFLIKISSQIQVICIDQDGANRFEPDQLSAAMRAMNIAFSEEI